MSDSRANSTSQNKRPYARINWLKYHNLVDIRTGKVPTDFSDLDAKCLVEAGALKKMRGKNGDINKLTKYSLREAVIFNNKHGATNKDPSKNTNNVETLKDKKNFLILSKHLEQLEEYEKEIHIKIAEAKNNRSVRSLDVTSNNFNAYLRKQQYLDASVLKNILSNVSEDDLMPDEPLTPQLRPVDIFKSNLTFLRKEHLEHCNKHGDIKDELLLELSDLCLFDMKKIAKLDLTRNFNMAEKAQINTYYRNHQSDVLLLDVKLVEELKKSFQEKKNQQITDLQIPMQAASEEAPEQMISRDVNDNDFIHEVVQDFYSNPPEHFNFNPVAVNITVNQSPTVVSQDDMEINTGGVQELEHEEVVTNKRSIEDDNAQNAIKKIRTNLDALQVVENELKRHDEDKKKWLKEKAMLLEENDELLSEKDRLKSDNEDLTNQVEELINDKQALQKNVSARESQLQSLNVELTKQQKEFATQKQTLLFFSKEMEEMKKKLQSLEKDKKLLVDESAKTKLQLATMQTTLQKVKAEKDNLQLRVNGLQSNHDNSQALLATMQLQLKRAEAKLQEANSLTTTQVGTQELGDYFYDRTLSDRDIEVINQQAKELISNPVDSGLPASSPTSGLWEGFGFGLWDANDSLLQSNSNTPLDIREDQTSSNSSQNRSIAFGWTRK